MKKSNYTFSPHLISHPGETLKNILHRFGMTQAELSEQMGRPRKTINEIIKGRAAITPLTAIQLEDALGISAEFWVIREAQYRLQLARIQMNKSKTFDEVADEVIKRDHSLWEKLSKV